MVYVVGGVVCLISISLIILGLWFAYNSDADNLTDLLSANQESDAVVDGVSEYDNTDSLESPSEQNDVSDESNEPASSNGTWGLSVPTARSADSATEVQNEQSAEQGSVEISTDSPLGHTHVWKTETYTEEIPAVTHSEKVTNSGEDIVEYHTECNACGAILDTEDALAFHFQQYGSHAKQGYTTNVPVVVGQTEGTSETVTVVDQDAYTKTITKRVCTICGQEEDGN